MRGNSLLRHQDVGYDNVVLVGGFSKAYSSLLAFLALPTRLKDALKVLAPPYLYSGPSPVASLATTLAGLDVNAARGDRIRADLWRKTHRLLGGLEAAGIDTPNVSGLPIVEVPLQDHDEIDDVGRYLFDHGVYATMAAYPLVPKHEVGFRLQVTAANTDAEIEHAVDVLGGLRDRFRLRQVAARAAV
jgi:8-amino-7-oxononanoate synthase